MKALGNTILAIVIVGVLAGALFFMQGRRNPLCKPALIVGYPDNYPQEIITRVIDEQGGLPQTDADLDAPDVQVFERGAEPDDVADRVDGADFVEVHFFGLAIMRFAFRYG